ncbi:DUF6596 domain-containing protein [Streptomyces sp. NPDC000594]|uniref:DUF6596 domain-containing protein n=1 Tax=Streptomyces sp. NPDC000594 TaxID=3154261 RepID=UPI00332A486C
MTGPDPRTGGDTPAGTADEAAADRVRRTVAAVWRLESARIVAGLTRLVRDVGLAEELAQEALVAALERWPRSGVPETPGAWLTAVARRRAVDHIRRSKLRERREEELAHELARSPGYGYGDAGGYDGGYDGPADPDDGWSGDARSGAGRSDDEPSGDGPSGDDDDVLRLMFVSCHPVLPTPARVALTLRLLGGLTAGEIARAFLATETVIARRIADAKRALAEEGVAFELPDTEELAERLSSVLEVIYLIFNEGYTATSGEDLLRPSLTLEALRLGRLLARLAPDRSEVHGLVALMEIQESRSAARTGPGGEPVPLHEQNRGRWDPLLVRRGFAALLRARDLGGVPGPYVLQAAIAVTHARAATAEETDWASIAALYRALERLVPTAVVRLNSAIATGMAEGPAAGLARLDTLASEPSLRDYHLLPAARGDLLLRLGRAAEARIEFGRAADLTRNTAERAFLLRRAESAGPPPAPEGPTLGGAAGEFLAGAGLEPATALSYRRTLDRLRRSLGDGLPLTELNAERVAGVFTSVWDGVAPATWNRHRAAVGSFARWAELPEDPVARIPRRTTAPAPARTAPGPAGEDWWDALWLRTDIPVRERTLWRLLYESGAPVTAVLGLDAERLDLADRRARSGRRWVRWRSGTAALLPELLAGRTRGPLFLTDRRPGPARTPSADLCPETGRARLSYERAEYLFARTTRALDPSGRGGTLGRLRKAGSAGPGDVDRHGTDEAGSL